MAYNEKLAERIRKQLIRHKPLTERKMFGGLSFMLGGHMCCGVEKDKLVVRVGPKGYEEALAQVHARPMDFTGRPMKGFVYVAPGGYRTDEVLTQWLRRGVDFVESLPKKKKPLMSKQRR